jgi:hypothetical protein
MSVLTTAIKLKVGVSWDQFTDKKIDLDLTASVFDGYGCVVDAAFFNNAFALGGTSTADLARHESHRHPVLLLHCYLLCLYVYLQLL